MKLEGDDRLDCWATESTAVALANTARSTAADLERQQIWHRPVGAYLLPDVIALTLLGLFRPHVTNDELLGLTRALAAGNIPVHLSDRVKAHARNDDRELAQLPDPADPRRDVTLVVMPRTSKAIVANSLKEIGAVVCDASDTVRAYRLAPVLAPVVMGFNGQARTGSPPSTRARGRPKKADVIRLVR
jgi:hypothetical protein